MPYAQYLTGTPADCWEARSSGAWGVTGVPGEDPSGTRPSPPHSVPVLHQHSTSLPTLTPGHAPITNAATEPRDSIGEGLSLALMPGAHSFNVFWLSDTFQQLTHTIIPWFKKEASKENQQAGGIGMRTGCSHSLHHPHWCCHEPEGNLHSQDKPREEPTALRQERQGEQQETQGAAPMPALGAHPSSSQAVLPAVVLAQEARGSSRSRALGQEGWKHSQWEVSPCTGRSCRAQHGSGRRGHTADSEMELGPMQLLLRALAVRVP